MHLPWTDPERPGGVLLFSMTPPRASLGPERTREVAGAALARLETVRPDGLVLYDIADEAERTTEERPFPFLPTMDPADYLDRHLSGWDGPVVVYRAVAKYTESEIRSWLDRQDPRRVATVFVGAPSRTSVPRTSLRRAQALHAATASPPALGGVAIPERHTAREDEHLRVLGKQDAGCAFFVTQVVYDVNAAKSFVSDYAYECRARGVAPRTIVFTFTVVGSVRTLEFLGWLGVDVPRWIRNDITHSDDTLTTSAHHALGAATDLVAFCRRLGVPFGLNVESVSNRRVEVDEAVALARRFRVLLDDR